MSKFLLLSLAVCCLSFITINCSENPSTITSKDDQAEDDPTPNKVPIIIIDSTTSTDSADLGELHFNVDFSELIKDLESIDSGSNVLKKSLADNKNRSGEIIHKIKHLSNAEFTFTDSLNRSVKSNYPIDSTGKCAVRIIKILRGFSYQVRVGFSGTTICPWFPKDSSFTLLNEFFSALDTINLKTKSRDTLNFVLRENSNTICFVSIKNPFGKYTEGKKYSIVEAWNQGPKVQALYSGGELKHRIRLQTYDTVGQFTVDDDTGKAIFSFSFSTNSVIDNDIIEGTARADEGEGVVINQIVFEHQDTLKVLKIEPKDGGIALYFNRSGKIFIGDSSIFKVTLGSNPTNLAKKTELKEMGTYIHWLPTTSFESGTYAMEASGFLDEYGNKSILINYVIIFQ